MYKIIVTIAILFAYSGMFSQTWNTGTGAWISPLSKNIGIQKSLQVGDNVGTDSLWCKTDLNYFEGNVGIGTATPTAKLEIVHGGLTVLIDSTSSSFTYSGGGGFAQSWNDNSISMGYGGNTLGIDTNSGFLCESTHRAAFLTNVGIGTTTPEAKLHVSISDTTGIEIAHFENNSDNAIMTLHSHADSSAIYGMETGAYSAGIGLIGVTGEVLLTNGLGAYAIEIDTTGSVTIPDLAGSAQKLVTALADGRLDTAVGLSAFTIDASLNMFAGTNALSGLNGGGFNFAAGIEAGSGNNSGTPVKSGNSNTLIGYGSDVSDTIVSGGTAIGFNTIVGEGSLAIGSNISVSGTNSIGVGSSFTHNTSIGLYSNPTDVGQFVALPIDWYINGVTRTDLDADTVSLNAPGTTGSNSIGTVFYINAGAPTGNATPGQLIFQTAPSGASGATVGTLAPAGKFDASATAGDTRFFLYDVDNGTLERVTVGAADSGGVGFKVLRIPN